MSAPDKGKFSTDISNDLIREALESVRKRSPEGEAGSESEAPPEAAAGDDGASSAPAEGAGGEELETLRAQLAMSQSAGRDLMEKLKDTHERMLRAVADLDNFKKRANKEKDEVQKFGNERLLREFLPVMDNLERALEAARTEADFESLRTGISMTRKQFEDALGKHGVKAFSAVGQPFDPRLHEAMQQVETAEVPPNHVVSELVRGYTLNDRLVRPALVFVARAVTSAPGPSGGTETETTAEAQVESPAAEPEDDLDALGSRIRGEG